MFIVLKWRLNLLWLKSNESLVCIDSCVHMHLCKFRYFSDRLIKFSYKCIIYLNWSIFHRLLVVALCSHMRRTGPLSWHSFHSIPIRGVTARCCHTLWPLRQCFLHRSVVLRGLRQNTRLKVKKTVFSVGTAFLSLPELLNEGNRGAVLNAAKSNYRLIYSHIHTVAEKQDHCHENTVSCQEGSAPFHLPPRRWLLSLARALGQLTGPQPWGNRQQPLRHTMLAWVRKCWACFWEELGNIFDKAAHLHFLAIRKLDQSILLRNITRDSDLLIVLSPVLLWIKLEDPTSPKQTFKSRVPLFWLPHSILFQSAFEAPGKAGSSAAMV